jgi:hypothetical protein
MLQSLLGKLSGAVYLTGGIYLNSGTFHVSAAFSVSIMLHPASIERVHSKIQTLL